MQFHAYHKEWDFLSLKEYKYKYEEYYDAQNGHDVTLTIDVTAQYYLESALMQAIEDYEKDCGTYKGLDIYLERMMDWLGMNVDKEQGKHGEWNEQTGCKHYHAGLQRT